VHCCTNFARCFGTAILRAYIFRIRQGFPFLGTIVENFCQVRVSEYRFVCVWADFEFRVFVCFGC
jgi:hypothetical protein